jgi:putative N-acetylmannosamine-6-phosphate epimerase
VDAEALARAIRARPLVASVQPEGWQTRLGPEGAARLAEDALAEGAGAVRAEGTAMRPCAGLGAPLIGLVKRQYEGSGVYITPTEREVDEALEAGCHAVALDATGRDRPGGARFSKLVGRVRDAGRTAVGDCDTLDAALRAEESGCGMLTTALAGYTASRPCTPGPDWTLLHQMVGACRVPVLAEGRLRGPEDFALALAAGAAGAVVGTALNDARRLARQLVRAAPLQAPVGALDVGGTWIRFAVFGPEGRPGEIERAPLPPTFAERLEWAARRIREAGVGTVGVSAGGTVDPVTGVVVESLGTIPDNLGRRYAWPGVTTRALNDGLASAWAHAHLPGLAGARVLTVAVGTGLGAGLVADHRLDIGAGGAYPRLNEAMSSDGRAFEARLCGPEPDLSAAPELAALCAGVFRPDAVVLCGGRGASAAFAERWPGATVSPFGQDAGLHGAAALAARPPLGVFAR